MRRRVATARRPGPMDSTAPIPMFLRWPALSADKTARAERAAAARVTTERACARRLPETARMGASAAAAFAPAAYARAATALTKLARSPPIVAGDRARTTYAHAFLRAIHARPSINPGRPTAASAAATSTTADLRSARIASRSGHLARLPTGAAVGSPASRSRAAPTAVLPPAMRPSGQRAIPTTPSSAAARLARMASAPAPARAPRAPSRRTAAPQARLANGKVRSGILRKLQRRRLRRVQLGFRLLRRSLHQRHVRQPGLPDQRLRLRVRFGLLQRQLQRGHQRLRQPLRRRWAAGAHVPSLASRVAFGLAPALR
jgi:hypothetical protein